MERLNKEYVVRTQPKKMHESYPIKMIQFGTGVLLRGLVDYIFQKAIDRNLYKGSIAIVKSTSSNISEFEMQNQMYTVVETGLDEDQRERIQHTLVTCISSVWSAVEDWERLKEAFRSADLELIVSNVTEIGLCYDGDANDQEIPASFPGKLTRLLFERFSSLQDVKRIISIPTELVVDNGVVLKEIVLRHAAAMYHSDHFISWIHENCLFCNSLVDRIVPGQFKPNPTRSDLMLPYEDNLAVQTEPYYLWAIEGDARVHVAIPFYAEITGLVLANDISAFREQKLRLLNGSHTIFASIAMWQGCITVEEMMKNELLFQCLEKLCKAEILPTLSDLSPDAATFYRQMKARWANPFIRHEWKSILAQTTTKMQARNGETLCRYHAHFGYLPPFLTFGFTFYLFVFRPYKFIEGKYFGKNRMGHDFEIADHKASLLFMHWEPYFNGTTLNPDPILDNILRDTKIFDHRFVFLPGFIATIQSMFKEINDNDLDHLLNHYSK